MSRRSELVRPLAEAQMEIIAAARRVVLSIDAANGYVGLLAAVGDLKNAIDVLDMEFGLAVERVSADLDRA